MARAAGFLILTALAGSILPARAQIGIGEPVSLSFPSGDLHVILLEYERLTGKKMIRDNAIEGGKVLMDTSGTLSRDQAIEFIEKSLLLNGFAIVPTASDPNLVKVIAFEAGKQPRNEGIRLVSHPADLPLSDEVVTYVMPLAYLSPDDAVAALQQIAPMHPYGAITPVGNAQALVITENSVTLRSYLELIEHIDVRPGTTEQRSFQLQRADAEEVAEALKELLGLDETESGSTPRPAGTSGRPATPAAPAAAATAPSGLPPSPAATGSAEGTGSAPAPRLFPVLRTNRLLVIATPFDMARIALLVEELDAPSDSRRFLSIPLRYVSVLGVLEPLRNSLLSGAKADEGGGGGLGGGLGGTGGGALRPQSNGGLNTGGGSSGFGNSTSGGGFGTNSGSSFGGGGGFGSSSFGGGGGGGGGNNQAPVSVIVGKTLLIADPVSNELFVSGPPDHLDTLAELVNQLDRKPRQVMIETVIGQLTLGDDHQHGVDWLRTLQTTGSGDSAVAGNLRFRDGGIPPVRGLDQFANLATAATSGLSIYGLIGDHLSSYLSLLEASNRFKVLSKPTVFTMNNVPAAISNGQRIAVPSSTLTQVNQVPGANAAVSATVQFEEVVLEIEVIPLINSEDELTLQIRQQNEDVSGTTNIGGNEVPNITTQQLQTTVVVPNRSSVLLGGLITERERDTRTGLPLLSRVPVARHLAGNTRNRTDRSELLIFIQPTIVERPQYAESITNEVTQDAALAPAVPAFPTIADPQTREFAAPGGKIPAWRKLFGRRPAASFSVPVP